jgi:putative RecB family exonuclease
LELPSTLSPSKVSAFTDCALAFRYSVIDRLHEPPTVPAAKGTVVHRALELLHSALPAERTLDHALDLLVRARAEVLANDEYAELEVDDAFDETTERLVRRYFELEDPTAVRAIGLELKMEAAVGAVRLRGIIDRLELDENDELVVTDYKTGSAPSEGWEQKSMAGVHIYSLLCERMFGRRPARVQLLYLSKPERIITAPSDQSLRGVDVKTNAVMQAVRTACKRDDFRPRASALCNYCSFQEFCPEFDGQPELARPTLLARQAEREGRPQLPLVFA